MVINQQCPSLIWYVLQAMCFISCNRSKTSNIVTIYDYFLCTVVQNQVKVGSCSGIDALGHKMGVVPIWWVLPRRGISKTGNQREGPREGRSIGASEQRGISKKGHGTWRKILKTQQQFIFSNQKLFRNSVVAIACLDTIASLLIRASLPSPWTKLEWN